MFVYEKENLDLIPLDLVGIQMQSKAAAVCGVNGGVLRLVRVVHHTILAVLDVGVNFYIIIGAEPCMQFLLAVGTPQDGTIEGAAVGKAVRHTADVWLGTQKFSNTSVIDWQKKETARASMR